MIVFAVARPRLHVDRRGAGRDDDVVCAVIASLPPSFVLTSISVGDLNEASPREKLHAVGFEERLDAADVCVHDVGLELRNAFALDFGLGNFQADRAGALDVTNDFADVQQRFGRNAAPVEADAADLVAVDADDFLAELPEPDRDVIAARARRR